jgi:hypothetical protein
MWQKITSSAFTVAWLFVGASSSLDTFLTIKFADYIREENPIGRALIRLGPNLWFEPRFVTYGVQDVSLLVGVKMFGTILALGILIWLYYKWRLGAQLVAAGLSCFQMWLLFYLFQ